MADESVLTETQLAAVNKLVTDGIAAGLKGIKVPSAEDLGKLVDGKLTGITDAITKLTEGFTAISVKPDDKTGKDSKPEDKAAILDLTKKLEQLTAQQGQDRKAREDAEAKALSTDKESKIRSVLQEFQFTSDAARNDAFSLIAPLINRDGEGNLLGQGDLPFDSFIRTHIPEARGYLLQPENRTGGGPTNGGGNKTGGSGKFDIDMIKPNMSKEQLMAAAKAIQAALPAPTSAA